MNRLMNNNRVKFQKKKKKITTIRYYNILRYVYLPTHVERYYPEIFNADNIPRGATISVFIFYRRNNNKSYYVIYYNSVKLHIMENDQ